MDKWKERVKRILPGSIALTVDGIDIPCYNACIAGGVLMSNKNKIAPMNDASVQRPAVGEIAKTVETMYAQTQATKLHIDDNTRIIIQDEKVPGEIRVKTLSDRDELYRLESDNRHKLIVNCVVSATIIICLGLACGTAVKLYTVKRAA